MEYQQKKASRTKLRKCQSPEPTNLTFPSVWTDDTQYMRLDGISNEPDSHKKLVKGEGMGCAGEGKNRKEARRADIGKSSSCLPSQGGPEGRTRVGAIG